MPDQGDEHERILPAFWRYGQEGRIIGRLLAGYSELELELAGCLGTVLQDDDLGLRTVFRIRGEEQRILIADALMRPIFEKEGLVHAYAEMIADLSYCKKIRNQYAHCQWYDMPEFGLCFIQLEDWAKKSKPYEAQRKKPLDVNLLKKQEHYFRYVQRCQWYLMEAFQDKVGAQPSSQLFPLPKKINRPPLHNGVDTPDNHKID